MHMPYESTILYVLFIFISTFIDILIPHCTSSDARVLVIRFALFVVVLIFISLLVDLN